MSVDIDLAGQRLLVVGGSSGIGRSTAIAAANAGADITVVGRSEDKLKEVVTTAGKGTGIAADVRDPERCSGIVGEAVDAMGGIDALVFSTAVSPLAPLDEVSADTWQDVITTNAIAPALVAQAALDHIPENGPIIFLSSITVGGGHHGLASYGASKAALDRTVRSWRMERPDKRFVCMAVGDTLGTDFAARLRRRARGRAVPEVAGRGRDLPEPHGVGRPRAHHRRVRGDAARAPEAHHPRAHHRAAGADDVEPTASASCCADAVGQQ